MTDEYKVKPVNLNSIESLKEIRKSNTSRIVIAHFLEKFFEKQV